MNSLTFIETNLTSEILEFIDVKLKEISTKESDAELADMLGYYDSMEHLSGLAFVACQAYITAVYGISRIKQTVALTTGPAHHSGVPFVAIVNSAANYWKHNNEWGLDRSPSKQKRIRETFDAVGCPVNDEYPLSRMLAELSAPNPASFWQILRRLNEWRKETVGSA